MPRRRARRGRSGRRGRRQAPGSIVPIYPPLYGPGHAAGLLGRWLARRSRFGVSRALVALIVVTAVMWILVGLAEL